MARLPSSLVENAHVDGASHMQIYWHVVIPLSGPALAALGVLLFVWRRSPSLSGSARLVPQSEAPCYWQA